MTAANGSQKVLNVQPFFVEDESIRQKIAKSDMAALNMDLETQKNRFVMGGGQPAGGLHPGTGLHPAGGVAGMAQHSMGGRR